MDNSNSTDSPSNSMDSPSNSTDSPTNPTEPPSTQRQPRLSDFFLFGSVRSGPPPPDTRPWSKRTMGKIGKPEVPIPKNHPSYHVIQRFQENARRRALGMPDVSDAVPAPKEQPNKPQSTGEEPQSTDTAGVDQPSTTPAAKSEPDDPDSSN
jgi:hypothetical protein